MIISIAKKVLVVCIFALIGLAGFHKPASGQFGCDTAGHFWTCRDYDDGHQQYKYCDYTGGYYDDCRGYVWC
jgi:hypothetical protein